MYTGAMVLAAYHLDECGAESTWSGFELIDTATGRRILVLICWSIVDVRRRDVELLLSMDGSSLQAASTGSVSLLIAFSFKQLHSDHAAQGQVPDYASSYHSSYTDHSRHEDVDSIIV